MYPRVKSAIAVSAPNALPAHPAPDSTNIAVVFTNTETATLHRVSDATSLVQIRVSADVAMLANASPDVGNIGFTGFPLTAGGYFSYAVRPGSLIAFQSMSPTGSMIHVLEG